MTQGWNQNVRMVQSTLEFTMVTTLSFLARNFNGVITPHVAKAQDSCQFGEGNSMASHVHHIGDVVNMTDHLRHSMEEEVIQMKMQRKN